MANDCLIWESAVHPRQTTRAKSSYRFLRFLLAPFGLAGAGSIYSSLLSASR
jgi:hypothetical protein